MSFTRLARFFLPLSGLLVLASLVLLFYPGPKLSIEFTGGTQIELQIPEGKTKEDLATAIHSFTLHNTALEGNINKTKTDTYFVRIPPLSNEEHTAFVTQIKTKLGSVNELQYTTIGPTVGATLKGRAIWALAITGIAILIFMAFSFRKIPRHLNPWSFGAAAITALIHDILIICGIFTILSHYTTFQIDTLFVTALLSIMGHSVSDTIVIFDRIREKVFASGRREDFGELADAGLRECVSRTINTGMSILIMLTALFLFGSESIHWFILALILGTIVGMYSSYFIATPILVYWRKYAGDRR